MVILFKDLLMKLCCYHCLALPRAKRVRTRARRAREGFLKISELHARGRTLVATVVTYIKNNKDKKL